MRVALVSRESMLLGRKCRKCTTAVVVGEVVLHVEVPTAAFDERHLVIHKACIEAMFEAGPPERTKRAVKKKVDAVAAEILASGSLLGRPRS